jgi:hypothetical protein
MTHQRLHLGRLHPGLLAVVVVAVLPSLSFGENLVFRNETARPVVVHAMSVFHGVLRRERPHLLHPHDLTPPIALPGAKLITIFDARIPNRILFQGSLPAGHGDLLFRILPDSPAPRVRLEEDQPVP